MAVKIAGHENREGSSQDPATPRALVRGLILHMRMVYRWQHWLEDVLAVMPVDSQGPYKDWATIELRPSFDDLLRLIERARCEGLITDDECRAVRAGEMFPVFEEKGEER